MSVEALDPRQRRGRDLSQGDDAESIAAALTLLFEHSPLIQTHLVPLLSPLVSSGEITDYGTLLDKAISAIQAWPTDLKAQFIAAHPRIGETKNLSALSAAEQQQTPVNPSGTMTTAATQIQSTTPPEVLEALRVLNECYEIKYPGLVYITFVNGRSRAEIADEMRDKLSVRGVRGDQDSIRSAVVDRESEDWLVELDRAVRDVGLIAGSRFEKISNRV